MTEMTPEKLRALGDGMTTGEVPAWTPHLYAAADAWGSERRMLLMTIGVADTAIGELRERLEALKRLLKACVIHLDKLRAEEDFTPRHAATDLLKKVRVALREADDG